MQKLTLKIIEDLHEQKFNILRSNSSPNDKKQVYWPDRVSTNPYNYIESINPLREKLFIVVDAALTAPPDFFVDKFIELN